MKFHIKAALLSACVLPGLGQLYKGSKIKGGIIIVLVNLFLLGGLFVVLQGMGEMLVTARLSGMDAAAQVIEGLRKGQGPTVKTALALFTGMWLYSVLDASAGKAVPDNDSDGEAGNNV